MEDGMNGFTAVPADAQTRLDGWHTQTTNDVCDLPGAAATVCQYRQFNEFGGRAVGAAANSVLEDLVDALVDGTATVLRFALSWWTQLPSPQLESASHTPGPVLASVREYTSGLQVLLMTGGILFAAARLALAKRGGLAGEAQESFLIFARAVFASMMFAAIITTGTKAGDAYADWVLFDATHGDLNGAVERLGLFDLRTHLSLGTGLLLVIGLLGMLSMLVQLVMLVVRQALLVLVVAALPIAAAAGGTGPGSQAYKRMLSWALAFVLWKPVGALCYAIAFTAAGANNPAGQQDPQLVLLGLVLLLMVAVVLPALMRLVAPAVATLGGGGGATAALAGGAVGIAMGTAGGGDRSEARQVGEGDNAPGGSTPPGGPPPGGGAPNGGGRPTPSGGGGSGSGNTGGGTGSASGQVAARSPSPAAGAAGTKSSASAGSGAGSAGAGGAVASGMVAAKEGLQQAGSVVESQVRDATEAGWDPEALGPQEVRR
ncbi:hypothetical protein [Nocardia blacklockiae]|uniref:hypothetical protein n=1 Tax=Nocardia blacklockiae TaxID=480036 RepID=UPI001896015B|nr:hypothetical protein [Nocardia blacklockiae]MBF6176050.1 hypothetical protein [Nocardia blacklockiae]